MKKNRRHSRHVQFDTHAVVEFFKRFGFVLFIAIIFLMLTFAVAFSQKRGNPQDKIKDEQTRIALGDTYAQQGNGGMAVSSYEEAASLNPQDPVPHYKIGTVYLRSKNSEAALEEFQKAVNVDPNYAPAYKELAELYYTSKNGAEAVKAQQKYMELSGSPDEGLVRLGYYLFMTRDFAETNEAFEKAYQKGLLNDTGLRYYALSLVESGNFAESQKMFEEYLSKAKPEQVEASDYAGYGKVLLKLGQDSLAADVLEKSLSIDNRQTPVKKMLWETLYSLGKSYYSKQQFALADTTFEKLIGLHPGIVTGYLWAGRANAGLDPESEKGLAKDFYEKVIEMGQANPENELEKVLSIDPGDENALKAMKVIKK